MINPIPHHSSVEQLEENEEKLIAEALEAMMSISKKTYADSGHGKRAVHAKSHALLIGELEIFGTIPEPYAQGIFTKPSKYPAIIRISTTPGDILPDRVSTPRGFAIKVIGVKGERLVGSDDEVTQAFLLVNGPALHVGSLKSFVFGMKPLAATTDKMEPLKVVVSQTLRGVEKVTEALGGQSARVKALGGEPPRHPLGETYFSQAPILYGKNMAKVSLAPVAVDLKELTGKQVDISDDPLALRHALRSYFSDKGGVWELRVQLCTDIEKMPIEDASVIWPEDESPYVAVARLTVAPQDSWSDQHLAIIDDGMSFSPWHCIADHRPLGSIMRARKAVYEQVSQFRASRNGQVIEEPRDMGAFTESSKVGIAS